MNHRRTSAIKRGFTLMELMVALAITSIIVTVLVSVTSIAMDTWNRSRSELRASRQAKSMIDSMAKDLECLVARRGNTNEWLSAMVPTTLPGVNLQSTNAIDLIFFASATDRYGGKIGVSGDNGGDVSCIAYKLDYKDPINPTGTSKFETFVFNRLLVDPDDAFKDMLGKTNLVSTLSITPTTGKPSPKNKTYSTQLTDPTNFICENIYQFSLTFYVQVTIPAVGATPASVIEVPVPMGKKVNSFKITGSGIDAPGSDIIVGGVEITSVQIKSGKLTAVGLSMSVLSDFGVEQSKRRTFPATPKGDEDKAKFLAQNSYQYAKLVQLPSL